MAGVSQATVSLVVNRIPEGLGRIPKATRERVEKIIRETGYVADPIARKMVKGQNRILGVFTYEPVFPSAQTDFFAPFLLGIEEAAQELGYDLLLLTGAAGQSKKIFGGNVRLRLADGCLILGRQFDRAELGQLVAGDYPFVAIGRRDDAGGPVPYVGADYVGAVRSLVEQAFALGHERLAYVGPSDGVESSDDRWAGFISAVGDDSRLVHLPEVTQPAEILLKSILDSGATVAFFLELADAVRVEALARAWDLLVPDDLSIVVLGNHLRVETSARQFTSFSIPREEMGRVATRMLVQQIEQLAGREQLLLPCPPISGTTLSGVPHD